MVTVTIQAGSPSAAIDIYPLDDDPGGGGNDDDNQPYQTVLAALDPSANYFLGAQTTASLDIYEEPLPPVEVVAFRNTS